MIITITLNPSLDYILQVNCLKLEETQRAEKSSYFASGKAINVSRVLSRMGVSTCAWGFLGGANGERFSKIIESENINTDFIEICDETRLNVIITELWSYSQLRVGLKGPFISKTELSELYQKIENMPEDIKFVSIGGSLPQDVPNDTYEEIIEIIHSKNIKCALDTSEVPLKFGIKAKPYLIKPNLHELCQILDVKELDNKEKIKSAASEIVNQGVKNVAVSMGKEGVIFVNENSIIEAKPPNIPVKSRVGAGDSMLAGFIYGILKDMPQEEIVKHGVAFGTASVLTAGTELAYKKDICNLLPQVQIAYCEKNNFTSHN